MKKFLSFTVIAAILLSILITVPVSAALKELPIKDGVSRPEYIAYYTREANGHTMISAYYIAPDEILELLSERNLKDTYGFNECIVFQQTDWSIDSDKNWHYTSQWDTKTNAAVTCKRLGKDMVASTEIFWLTYENNQEALGDAVYKTSDNLYKFDFSKHKLYLRTRFLIELGDYHKGFDGQEHKYYVSDWSDVVCLNDVVSGKSPYQNFDFSKLDALIVSDEQVKYNEDDGKPYLSFYLEFPESVKKAALALRVLDNREMTLEVERRVNGGAWTKGNYMANQHFGYQYGERKIFIEKEILENDSSLEYRFRFSYGGGNKVKAFTTPWSKTLKYNVPSWSEASSWAEEWLKKAEKYDLLPDILVGADMTKPITRQEFAALSVKLYEAMSGKTAVAVSNPFKDTNDPEILKAVNIGITNGTAPDKFSPNDLITREQAAAMLTRAYKAIFWEGWTLAGDGSYTKHTLDYSGVAPFADDADISPYAKPSVYFMAKNNIINGVGNNMFAPNRSNIPKNAAVTYGQATREAAIKMAVGSLENLK